ncbi:MAG: serine protease [Bacteroidales bacterium]|nr:serine protease [Bacteroidales bacterium]MCF8391247.1 serine protease [Bacteroidales bacterium]
MILSISDSWQGLQFIEKLYWCIALPFSLMFIIQIIITFFVGDIDTMEAEGDVDTSIEEDSGIHFQFLSIKNLIAFFTIFGWTGIACLAGGLNNGLSILISTLAGIAMMIIMASLAYFMGKLVDDGTLKVKNAIGKVASVYLRIPANRSGVGKVQVSVQGLQTLEAMTDNDEEIKTGAIVEIVEILGNDILLVKLSGK